MGLDYIFTGFENASPIDWYLDDSGVAHVSLIYDRERQSPNRAVLHWHFQLQASPGTDVTLLLKNFDNIWNGRPGSPILDETSCAISEDGKAWTVVTGRKTAENFLKLKLRLGAGNLSVARIEPYRLSDLQAFISRISDHPLVGVAPIGQTVEGRPLEMLRIGREDAPYRLLLRARAHPWETGGNWLLEGLIRRMMEEPPDFCLYAMPIANKDGVARGRSRFNLMGKDLNRDWGRPADPKLAPENAALESWLDHMREENRAPHLAIDLHNDNSGKLHISRPEGDYTAYLSHMETLEQALRDHTWFTEGSTGATFRNPGSFGGGLLVRYGIDACILELNCHWSAGLNKAPLGADWMWMGQQMHTAFSAYFGNRESSN